MSKLHLKRLSKRYGAVTAVDRLDLALNEGELVTLLGPSGCGKTTTLRMIAGFIDPSEGTIEVDGRVVSSPGRSLAPERRSMAMIFQSYAIWPNMTVAQNVGFGLAVRKLPRDEVNARVTAILDVVQLGALAGRYPAELSGGQQQRVALARAIVVRPAVLLLDEPLSNLDANLREEMAAEIRRLHDAFNMTTVYVTHDQAEAMTISDRVAVMHAGRIEQVDTPWNIYNRPTNAEVASFIGRTNLIDGEVRDGVFQFDGFALPLTASHHDAASLHRSAATNSSDATSPDGGVSLHDTVPPGHCRRLSASIRPRALHVAPAGTPPRAGQTSLGLAVVEGRTYLGAQWDYVMRPLNSRISLKVSTGPTVVLEIGTQIALSVEVERVAFIAR